LAVGTFIIAVENCFGVEGLVIVLFSFVNLVSCFGDAFSGVATSFLGENLVTCFGVACLGVDTFVLGESLDASFGVECLCVATLALG
jgi:hypothetical protein